MYKKDGIYLGNYEGLYCVEYAHFGQLYKLEKNV